MERNSYQASITVFLSLICLMFLALICAATESARIQGAKAQSAAITGMGTFSLMSEFEPDLLKEYEIFALDGGRTGSFQLKNVNDRLETYLTANANPKDGLLKSMNFDPWNLSLKKSSVCAYALLTDHTGEAFYQQAVEYMNQNLPFFAVDKLMDLAHSEELIENQQAYENAVENSDRQMENLEAREQEALDEQEENGEIGTLTVTTENSVENPIPVLQALRKGVILTTVAGDMPISDKTIKKNEMPSCTSLQKGTMEVENKYGGFFHNVLFREYLALHFPNFTSKKSGEVLDYQLEYIMYGNASDQENMKKAVFDLMLLRAGVNFVFCNIDSVMRSEAQRMAVSLTAWIPIPALAAAAQPIVQEVIVGLWSFGESLVDLRCLLKGGKVPIKKDRTNWQLKLSDLINVFEIMRSDVNSNNTKGLSYTDHLRILLFLGKGGLGGNKMRALDMIQAQMRAKKGMGSFKVENCIVGVETSATYHCNPVFFGLPAAVMGTSWEDQIFTQTAGLLY